MRFTTVITNNEARVYPCNNKLHNQINRCNETLEDFADDTYTPTIQRYKNRRRCGIIKSYSKNPLKFRHHREDAKIDKEEIELNNCIRLFSFTSLKILRNNIRKGYYNGRDLDNIIRKFDDIFRG